MCIRDRPATDIETLRESIQSANATLADESRVRIETNATSESEAGIDASGDPVDLAGTNVAQQRTQLPPLDPGNRAAVKLNSRDPFDPDVFNKQYGSAR